MKSNGMDFSCSRRLLIRLDRASLRNDVGTSIGVDSGKRYWPSFVVKRILICEVVV